MSASLQISVLIGRSFATAVALFLVLPLLVIVPMSFSDTRYLAMPQGGLSLRHYAALFADPAWANSLRDSLLVALPASLFALVWGTAFALGAWQRGGRAVRLLQVLMLGPLIVPGVIHAVAYHKALSLLGLFDSYAGTIIVHTVKALPFVVLAVTSALASVNPATRDIARSLGASEAQALSRAVLPQIRVGLGIGFLFAFVTSWDEIVVTLFISSRDVVTLPRQIWQGLYHNLDPTVSALGSIAIALTLIVVAVAALRQSKST